MLTEVDPRSTLERVEDTRPITLETLLDWPPFPVPGDGRRGIQSVSPSLSARQ